MHNRTETVAEEERGLSLSERKPITMPLLMLLGILSITATFVYGYSNLRQTEDRQATASVDATKRIDDHEARLRSIESTTGRMDANLQQIREWMAEDRRSRVRAP